MGQVVSHHRSEIRQRQPEEPTFVQGGSAVLHQLEAIVPLEVLPKVFGVDDVDPRAHVGWETLAQIPAEVVVRHQVLLVDVDETLQQPWAAPEVKFHVSGIGFTSPHQIPIRGRYQRIDL
jgi:hypothetical protein